ncbi:hypothetical protein GCM10025770_37490 [Viridibacterium curvum]|uniref:Uncharacterized protein n=1 Tax=Viridibacterium curvum TaxID=1101404 RepID=A0ABP9R6J9_9RHOO
MGEHTLQIPRIVIPASFTSGIAALRSPPPHAGEGLGERAGAEIQRLSTTLNSRLRGNDGWERTHFQGRKH